MGMILGVGRCDNCGEEVMVVCQRPRPLLHFALTLLSAGLWLTVWLAIRWSSHPCICCSCGRGLSLRDVQPTRDAGANAAPWSGGLPQASAGNFNAYLVAHDLVYYVPTLAVYDGR